MDYKNTLLLITAGINFGMSIVLFLRSRGNKTSWYFGWVLLFTALWSLFMFYFRVATSAWMSEFSYINTYSFGLLLTLTMLFFTNYFPYASKKISRHERNFLLSVLIIIFFLMYVDPDSVTNLQFHDGWSSAEIKESTFIIFAVYISYLFVRILWRLRLKALQSQSLHRIQIRWAIFGIAFAIATGSICDVVLLFYGNYYWNWIGPVSSLVMNFIIIKLIFIGPVNDGEYA